jgi:hypothetical protein
MTWSQPLYTTAISSALAPGNQRIDCGDELLGHPAHTRRHCLEELAVDRYRFRCDCFHSFPGFGAILRTMLLATLRRTMEFSLTCMVSGHQTRHCCLPHASTSMLSRVIWVSLPFRDF